MQYTQRKLYSALAPLLLACGAISLAGCAGAHKPAPGDHADPARSREQAMALFARAQKAHHSRDYPRAESLYREGLALDDDISGAWNNLGTALLEQGKFMEAVPVFARAADLSPRDPTPYENLGLLYHRAGYAEESLDAYSRSLARDPNWLPSLRGAVVCAKLLNKSDEDSLDRAKRALLIERDEAWRRIFQSQRLRIENDLKEAALRP